MENISSLLRAKKEGFVVSIYSNWNEPEKCSVGFVEDISNDQIILKHITPHGLNDGYAIRKRDDVFRVDLNGQYEKRLLTLYNLQGQKHINLLQNKTDKDSNLFKEALLSAQKLNMVINACIDETEAQESIVGWVKEVNNDEVVISQISFDGLDDGESIIFIANIVKINCDSLDERVMGLLNSELKK